MKETGKYQETLIHSHKSTMLPLVIEPRLDLSASLLPLILIQRLTIFSHSVLPKICSSSQDTKEVMMIPVVDLHADTYMKKHIFNTLPWVRKAYFKLPSEPGREVQYTEDITKESLVSGNVRLQTQSLFIGDLGETNPLHNGLKMVAN